MSLPEAVELRTPCCGRRVRPGPFYAVASDVVRRTCPACRGRYVVRLVPLGTILRGRGHVTEVSWLPCRRDP